jgi:WD40 repeat protein
LAEREVFDAETTAVAYSTDGARIAVGTDAGEVFALDAATLVSTGPRLRFGTDPLELIPVPGGKRFVIALKDADYALVDLGAGEVLHHYTPGAGISSGVAVSPDGTKLALGTPDGDVGVLDLRSSSWVSQPRRGHESVVRIDWAPDGLTFATSGPDGRVLLWSGETGERLTSVRPGQPGSAAGLEFLADGHTLQIATELGEVYRWDTRLSYWIDFACRAAGRNLTEEEWADAFDQEPYRKTCPD